MDMVSSGKTNAEIWEAVPAAYSKLNYIEQARQTLLEERYKNEWRKLDVTYIWVTPVLVKPAASWNCTATPMYTV